MKHRKGRFALAMAGGSLAALAAAAVIGSGAASQTATNATAVRPAAQTVKPAATTAQSAATPLYHPNFKPGPMFLRKPQAPAPVLWSQATAQMARLRQTRPVNSLASRLPKAELDRTRLPVLLPHDGGFVAIDKTRLFSFGDAYAMNLPQPKGTQITLYGNRSFVAADAGAISKRPVMKLAGMPEDVRIDQTEDGWTATFTRYGVVYSIDVTCDDMASPDCTSDSFLRKAITQFDDVALGQDATNEANGASAATKPKPDWLSQVFKSVTGGK
ncbi:MAG: hypothetical protein ACXU8O_03625 [Asticcacaulis sp.]